MSTKLVLVPQTDLPESRTTASEFSAPSAPGIYDTLRASLTPATSSVSSHQQGKALQCQSTHPLESRLAQWDATQMDLRLASRRRQLGLTSTLGLEMQLLAMRCEDSVSPRVLDGAYKIHGGRSIHHDILMGRDCSLDWEDVFVGDDFDPLPDIHLEMDRRMGVGKSMRQ